MKYIVKVSKPLLSTGIDFIYYVQRIVSYKKGWSGIILSLDIEHAHKYYSESTAQKASIAYNGEVVII